MKIAFNCMVLYYNMPVFFKVSQINNNEYLAESLGNHTSSFTVKKSAGEWYGESETSHSLAVQIGKHIDKIIS